MDLDNFFIEIESTLGALRKRKEASIADHHMENKVLRDYAMSLIDGTITNIQGPVIQAVHFKIKPAIIQMIHNTMQITWASTQGSQLAHHIRKLIYIQVDEHYYQCHMHAIVSFFP